MNKKKINTLIGVLLVIAVIGVVIGNKIHKENLIKQTIINDCTSVGEQFGLKDISVIITGKSSEHDWYNVGFNCSNLEILSPTEMIELDRKMGSVEDAYIGIYNSNGNTYNIYPLTLSVYKNGEQVYDDYYNSTSHKSAVENENSVSQTSGTTVTNDDELGTCWALATEVVEAQLKSPSSAKFPFSYADEDVSITKSGNTFTVKSWVEAENSFGATLRSNFTVTMSKSGTKFTADSCIIDE